MLETPYFLWKAINYNNIKTKNMKENILYEPSKVEATEVKVENIFAISGYGQNSDGYEFGN